jgi:hypothetical protein
METLSVWGEPTALHVIFDPADTGIDTQHEAENRLQTWQAEERPRVS